jgi:DNA-binding response OmpR family regulator
MSTNAGSGVFRAAEVGMRHGRRTVVVVDDDADLRFLCAEVLRAARLDVIECATLAAGFATLRKVVPEIVLLDGDLPDGSGLDLARWMRARGAYTRTRIVGFSGRKGERDIAAALDAGCNDFIGKPCSPAVLLAHLGAARAPS